MRTPKLEVAGEEPRTDRTRLLSTDSPRRKKMILRLGEVLLTLPRTLTWLAPRILPKDSVDKLRILFSNVNRTTSPETVILSQITGDPAKPFLNTRTRRLMLTARSTLRLRELMPLSSRSSTVARFLAESMRTTSSTMERVSSHWKRISSNRTKSTTSCPLLVGANKGTRNTGSVETAGESTGESVGSSDPNLGLWLLEKTVHGETLRVSR
mmetsp:Transcript_5668/g.11245  ORF Transcript_5668/g.11245 Transcript_5668/m.11245 type:complete len:211 (+) Transcript_5668:437-1069(+)